MHWTILTSLSCTPAERDSIRAPWPDNSINEPRPDNRWFQGTEAPEGLSGAGFSTDQVVPELIGVDQHGDGVSIWQFHGRVTVLNVSIMHCPPCQDLAQDVEELQLENLDTAVLVSVLGADLNDEPPNVDDAFHWSDTFGIHSAPVLADTSTWHIDATQGESYPRVIVTHEDMTVCNPCAGMTAGAIRSAIAACLVGP